MAELLEIAAACDGCQAWRDRRRLSRRTTILTAWPACSPRTNQVRFWRQQWFEWDDRCLKLLPAKVVRQVNVCRRDLTESGKRTPSDRRHAEVGRGMVSNIIARSSLSGQRQLTELGTWLGQVAW